MNQFKKRVTAFTAMLAFLSLTQLPSFAFMPGDVSGHTGNVTFGHQDASDNRGEVNLNGGRGAVGQVDWNTFNVNKDQHLSFGFSSTSQTMINRVLGGQLSSIMGKISSHCTVGSCPDHLSTSKVILINPAGVIFGNGSQVDLNSFTVSTFDFRGAKNLKDMNDTEKDTYQKQTLNVISPYKELNKGLTTYADGKVAAGSINFDSTYKDAFNKAGIGEVANKEGEIKLDGTTFADFKDDFNSFESFNKHKSVGLVGDKITYKDSIIRTGDNKNYYNNTSSFSNVRIITADGVTFSYVENGEINGEKIQEGTKQRSIDINNEHLAQNNKFASADTDQGIRSGYIHIANKSGKNSDVSIKNTIIRGTKLVNTETSRLQVVHVDKDTQDDIEGKILVSAGEDLNVNDSLLISAGSTNTNTDTGSITLYATNDANIKESEILARGNATVSAGKNIKLEHSMIQGADTLEPTPAENITLTAGESITADNSVLNATKDITVKVAKKNELTGKIDSKNSTFFARSGKVSLQSKDTTLENSNLVYNDLKF